METTMAWRKITAEQYRTGGDEAGDYDEARIEDPMTGFRREVWDVGCEHENGKVVIYTACAEPMRVSPDYTILVR
jgi:hypothetical protein